MDDHTTSDGAGPGGTDPAADAVQAGIEQFQRAALDAVRAARTMLEAAESVLQEPATARVVADTVSAFARTATETVAGFAAGVWPPPGPHHTTAAGDAAVDDDDGDEGPEPGFERIFVD